MRRLASESEWPRRSAHLNKKGRGFGHGTAARDVHAAQIDRDDMRIRGTSHCFVSDLFQIVNAAIARQGETKGSIAGSAPQMRRSRISRPAICASTSRIR